MDREVAIKWLDELDDMTDEGLACLERMISRTFQARRLNRYKTKIHPWNPSDPWKKDAKRYSLDELYKNSDVVSFEEDYIEEEPIEEEEVKSQEIDWHTPLDSLKVNSVPILREGHEIGWIKKEEDNMYTQIEIERKYLNNRLHTIQKGKRQLAENKHLPHTDLPKTGKAFKEAIANGWLKTSIKDDDRIHSDWIYYLRLEDPTKVQDKEAYLTEVVQIDKDVTATKDIISILPVDQGLKALQDFESKVYH